MADGDAAGVPDDPREWAPMRPYQGRRKFDIIDPIIEPFWSGVRVIVHVTSSPDADTAHDVAIIEDLGADVAPELPGLRASIARSVVAVDAVIDGVISRQIGLDGVGAATVPEMRGKAGLLMRNEVDLDVVPRGAVSDPSDAPDGLIVFDLLRIDGTSLLDVPLLERQRLLESVVEPSELVRTSVHVRRPIETWVATWKSVGLRGGILKAANSRYHPGTDSIEWRIVEDVSKRRR